MAGLTPGGFRYRVGRLLNIALLSPRARKVPGATRIYLSLYLLAKKIFEADERALLKSLVRQGMVVIEVGANMGAYTGVLARAVGASGSVHAFEPDPVSFEILQRRFPPSRFPNVELMPIALGASATQATLYSSPVNRSDSRLFPTPGLVEESLPVEVSTVDEYRARRGLRGIDAFKIDVQGGEVAALQGMTETVRESRPAWMWLEFTPEQLRWAGARPEDFWLLLDRYGFVPYQLAAGKLRRIEDCEGFTREHEGGFPDVFALARGTIPPVPY